MQVTQNPPEVVPLIEGHDLVVALQGNRILHGVSADVQPGQTVALMGGNGSGKTTLVRTLLGLSPHVSGTVRLFGQDLRSFHDWRRIGYVPQRGALTVAAATVEEIVKAGRLAYRKPFMPASRDDRKAVDEAIHDMGLEELRHRSYLRLSGGQQQRTLLARALCTHPDLLVLDEPLAGLDMASQRSLAQDLGRLKARGTGLLIVLHELGPMEDLIDRSIVLRSGEVIHDGKLLAGPGISDHHHYPHESYHPLVVQPPLPPRHEERH